MFVLEATPLVEPIGRPHAVAVTRWRRFRHDRAYVQVRGEHVGYRDLRSGAVHAFRDADSEIVATATADLIAPATDSESEGTVRPAGSRRAG